MPCACVTVGASMRGGDMVRERANIAQEPSARRPGKRLAHAPQKHEDTPLRVLLISHGHPDLSPGGAEIASHLLFQGLRETPEVEAYYIAHTDEPARRRSATPFSGFRDRPNEIVFYSDPLDGFFFSQQSAEIIDHFARLFRELRPDVIHFHHYTGIGVELIALARRLVPNVKIIVTLHEFLAICQNFGQMVKTTNSALCSSASPHECNACFEDVPASEFFLRELFLKAHFEKVDLFVAPSEFLRQRYVSWGIPGWQIVTFDNGIAPVSPPRPRALAAGERRTVFGFFGQIHPFKGLLQLLQAFDVLGQYPAEKTAGIRLVVHGAYLDQNPPPYVEAIKTLLARTAGRVHFTGPYARGDLGGLMAAVDWVVVPSIWWENSPLVIQEAFAHRRPVICSNIGGMAEKVRWGKDGFHFMVGNPFELASLIQQLSADPSVWDRLQQTIRQPVTVAQSVAKHLELYREAAFAVAS
jgi:glycosyltransferase involved in cell wall biosynthesis